MKKAHFDGVNFKPLRQEKPKKVVSKSVSELGKPQKQAFVVRKSVLSNKRYGISNLKRK